MYKKFAVFFVTLVMSVFCLIPVCAHTSEQTFGDLQTAIQAENRQGAEEIAEIQALLQDENQYKIQESGGSANRDTLISEYEMEGIRKVYRSQTLMLTAFEESHSVDSIFTESYHWLVPVNGAENQVAAFVAQENGKMHLGMIEPVNGRYISDAELYECISNSDVDIGRINAVKYLYAPTYYTTFAMIYTDSVTYCVPFTANADFLEMENKKVYIAEDMLEEMLRKYDEAKLLENPDANGGVPLRTTHSTEITVILVAALIVVAVSAYFLFRKTRKSKKSNGGSPV